MKNLSIDIPPFAPDYSGACSAMFSLNGEIIIHDASGCTGNYTTFDEPRWYGSAKPIYCSGLRKLDAVFGNEEALLEKALRAARERPVDFIAFVGSPVPMVIGTDFAGLAKEIEARSGIPAFGFATNGTRYYNYGVALAACALIDRFAHGAPKRRKRAVNLLGATPLEMSAANLRALFDLLREDGWEVLCRCAHEWTMDELRQIGAASVNLAISQAGREIAAHLEARFGTPWLADVPVGEAGARAFLQNLERAERGERPEEGGFDAAARAIVMEDWVVARAICRALEADFGIPARPVGLFGKTGLPEGAETADDESEIKAILRGATALVSDPVLLSLARPETARVSIPKYAISSRLIGSELFIGKYFNQRAAKLAAPERKA